VTPATLVVFARYPRPGEAKTRLAPVLGLDGAADLARRMLLATWAEALAAERLEGRRVELHGCGATGAEFSALLGGEGAFVPQSGEGFGERLERAFASAFERGAGRVVLVGADCPALSTRHIDEALVALESNDAVLGPARDGGWWLLGLGAPQPALFHGISWSTPVVFEQTLAVARASGLTVVLLEELSDVDRPDDLAMLGIDRGR
jgi:rSAM/selenodomain-associated transferase 1